MARTTVDAGQREQAWHERRRNADAWRRCALEGMESPPTRSEALSQAQERAEQIGEQLAELHADLFLEPELLGAVAALDAALDALRQSISREYADARYGEAVVS